MTEAVTAEQEANLALVRSLYAAFGDGDIGSLLQLLSEDIDWLFFGPTEIPFAGHFRGREEVAAFFQSALDTTEFIQFEPREFLPGAANVLVQGYERARAKSTGRVWETEWAHVFTLRAGQITKMREYYDTAVIAQAFHTD